jgi:hypothetical protein
LVLGRARFYSTDPSPPRQPAHRPFPPCVRAPGRCKADCAAVNSVCASCPSRPPRVAHAAPPPRVPPRTTLSPCARDRRKKPIPLSPSPLSHLPLLPSRSAAPVVPSHRNVAGVPRSPGLPMAFSTLPSPRRGRRSKLSESRSMPHRRCQHSPSTVRPGRHLLEDHTVALVLLGPEIGHPRPCTALSPSRFPARVASSYINLLVSFPSSPPSQITSPPLLDPPRIGSPPPHH